MSSRLDREKSECELNPSPYDRHDDAGAKIYRNLFFIHLKRLLITFRAPKKRSRARSFMVFGQRRNVFLAREFKQKLSDYLERNFLLYSETTAEQKKRVQDFTQAPISTCISFLASTFTFTCLETKIKLKLSSVHFKACCLKTFPFLLSFDIQALLCLLIFYYYYYRTRV